MKTKLLYIMWGILLSLLFFMLLPREFKRLELIIICMLTSMFFLKQAAQDACGLVGDTILRRINAAKRKNQVPLSEPEKWVVRECEVCNWANLASPMMTQCPKCGAKLLDRQHVPT